MSPESLLGLVVSALVLAYLVVAMSKPEKF